jgi:hypothetical protein
MYSGNLQEHLAIERQIVIASLTEALTEMGRVE